MDDTFRQMVIEKLKRGEDLPREFARELFPPEKREYELIYYGKEREEDIIADTMAVPLQPVKEGQVALYHGNARDNQRRPEIAQFAGPPGALSFPGFGYGARG